MLSLGSYNFEHVIILLSPLPVFALSIFTFSLHLPFESLFFNVVDTCYFSVCAVGTSNMNICLF